MIHITSRRSKALADSRISKILFKIDYNILLNLNKGMSAARNCSLGTLNTLKANVMQQDSELSPFH